MIEEPSPWYRRDLSSWLPRWLPAWLFVGAAFAVAAALFAGLVFDYESRSDQLRAIGLASLGAFAVSVLLLEAFHHANAKKGSAETQTPRAPVWIAMPLLTAFFMVGAAAGVVGRRMRIGRAPRGILLEGQNAVICGWGLVGVICLCLALFVLNGPRTPRRLAAAILSFLVVAGGSVLMIQSSR